MPTASAHSASAAVDAPALKTAIQQRVDAARVVYDSRLLEVTGITMLPAVPFDMIVIAGLLLDRQAPDLSPLYLGSVLSPPDYKCFGWVLSGNDHKFKFTCLLCKLSAKSACKDCTFEVAEWRNVTAQWTSHCGNFHPAMLSKAPINKTVPRVPTFARNAHNFFGPREPMASANAALTSTEAIDSVAVRRADTGRSIERFNWYMKRLVPLAASGALSFRWFGKRVWKNFVTEVSNGRITHPDMGGRDAVEAHINKAAITMIETMRSEIREKVHFNDGRFINGKKVYSLVANTHDGWSATAYSDSMQTGVSYVFANGRLYHFCPGYLPTSSKYAHETFKVQAQLVDALGVPLSLHLGRTVDYGSDGMAKEGLALWRAKYEEEGGKGDFYSWVCAAHGLDKALYWAATGGDGFAAIVKNRSSAKDTPVARSAIAASGSAEADGAVETVGMAETATCTSDDSSAGAGGGKKHAAIAKRLTLAIRMGAAAFSILAGDLFAIVTSIRNSPAAHKKLHKKSGYLIPKMVVTRWGVYNILLGRALLLWSTIKIMDPVKDLNLYADSTDAAELWRTRVKAIDASLPAIALVLSAQRVVDTALGVLGTTSQPTMPLVLPVITWMIEQIRLLTEAAFNNGASFSQPNDFLVDMKPVRDGKTTQLRLMDNEAPILLALRYLIGLQCAIFKRYPFEVIAPSCGMHNGYIIRSKIALVDAAAMGSNLLGQPLFNGRIRLLSGLTPFFSDVHVLAAVAHPRISYAAQLVDNTLEERAGNALTTLFNGMYGPIQSGGGGGGSGGGFNPFRKHAATADTYRSMLNAAIAAMFDAYLGDKAFSQGANRFSINEYKWLDDNLASHAILPAVHRATYSAQATSADPERTNSFGALIWNKSRRNLSAENGSSAVVVSLRQRELDAQRSEAPTLSSIPHVPEILHYLDSMALDDKLRKALPDLEAPPTRELSRTEMCICTYTDVLQLPAFNTVANAMSLHDEVEDLDASELLEALDSTAFVADDDGVAVMPVDFISALQSEEVQEGNADDFCVPTVAPPADLAYGRSGNRSLRIALRAAATAAAAAAAQASAATGAAADEVSGTDTTATAGNTVVTSTTETLQVALRKRARVANTAAVVLVDGDGDVIVDDEAK